jgi:hypothetical protein
MRRLFACLPLVFATLGCGPGSDPNLDQSCESRGERSVIVGTGEEGFQEIGSDGVFVQQGPQGGFHIWIALRCQNLGPRITASYGVDDLDTMQPVSQPNMKRVVELDYTGSADETAGLYGYLDSQLAPDLSGHNVKLWAEVTDSCGGSTRGEVATKVRGFQ